MTKPTFKEKKLIKISKNKLEIIFIKLRPMPTNKDKVIILKN
jgi:hypothetical protein